MEPLSLYPPQQRAIDALLPALRNFGACLNSSDTGTGKTLMTAEMCRRENLKPLVVCPKAVVPSWRETLSRQGIPYLDVVGWEKLRTGSTIWGAWENKKKKNFLWEKSVEAIVFDEVHRAKAPDSQNAYMVVGSRGRKVIMCSATASEDPSEMMALGYLLRFHEYWNFGLWARQNGCLLNEWRKLVFDPAFREHYLPLLHAQIYPDRGYRVTRADMGEFFTRTSIVTEPLDFEDKGEIGKVYEEMEVELEALKERQKFDAAGAEGLTAQLRARQKVEFLKVPLFRQFTTEALADGFSVVVFLNFRESIKAFTQQFDFTVPTIEGGQDAKAREQIIQYFAQDRFRVLVCNMEAGGLGVNLHDVRGQHPRMSLISPNWNIKTLLQVLGRIDRAGAKTDTIQRIFFAGGTVEDGIRTALEQKLQNIQTLHMNHVEEPKQSLMQFDPVTIWKEAKNSLLHNGLPEILEWEFVRVEDNVTLVLTGPEFEANRGAKMKITNAIRKAGKIGNLAWEWEKGLLADCKQTEGGFVQEKIGGTVVNRWEGAPPTKLTEISSELVVVLPPVEVQILEERRSLSLLLGASKALLPEAVEDTAHARFNPSSWGYVERCPSYQNRTDQEQEDLEAADAGTRFHKIIETGDPSYGEEDQERYHAARVIQWKEAKLQEHGLFPHVRTDYQEVKLNIQLPTDKTFGTCDHLSIAQHPYPDGSRLAVAMDWKYGLTPVDDAEVNGQVLAYSLGIFQAHPEVGILAFYIVLPRQQVISQAVFTRDKYPSMLLRAETINRRRLERGGKDFNPAPSLCEWCGNNSRCAALANYSLSIAKKYADTSYFELPDLVHGSEIEDPNVIAKLRTITPIIKKWCEGIEKKANSMAFEMGIDLPGFKKVYRATNRSISNPLSAYWLLTNPKSCGVNMEPVLTHDEFFACVSKVGITELLSVIGTKAPEGQKANFEGQIESLLRESGALNGGGDDTYGVLQIDRKAHK